MYHININILFHIKHIDRQLVKKRMQILTLANGTRSGVEFMQAMDSKTLQT